MQGQGLQSHSATQRPSSSANLFTLLHKTKLKHTCYYVQNFRDHPKVAATTTSTNVVPWNFGWASDCCSLFCVCFMEMQTAIIHDCRVTTFQNLPLCVNLFHLNLIACFHTCRGLSPSVFSQRNQKRSWKCNFDSVQIKCRIPDSLWKDSAMILVWTLMLSRFLAAESRRKAKKKMVSHQRKTFNANNNFDGEDGGKR